MASMNVEHVAVTTQLFGRSNKPNWQPMISTSSRARKYRITLHTFHDAWWGSQSWLQPPFRRLLFVRSPRRPVASKRPT